MAEGHVIIIGGAEDKIRERVILTRFIKLAGGPDARIAVISTASSLGPLAGEMYRRVFGELGASEVHPIHAMTRAQANDPEAARTVHDSTGIFLTGGNQLRLSSTIGGTSLAQQIVRRHREGAVIAGTSAGASAMSTHMVAFGASGSTPKQRMVQMAAGLGILPGVIIDQHFEARNRLGRLLAIIASNPSLLGIGVDEDTAGVVGPDRVMEVIGRRSVTILDGAESETDAWEVKAHRPVMISNVVLHSLPSGYRFDLERRERVAAPMLRALESEFDRFELTQEGPITTTSTPKKDAKRVRKSNAGPEPTLRILDTRVLRGPNVWWRTPAIAMHVDLGMLEEWPSNTIPDFNEALIGLLPTLEDHACSLGRRGGFISRLKEGTWLGHVSEHVAIELQSLAGTEVHLGKTRGAGVTGQYNVVYEFREEDVGLEAGRIAVALVNHLVSPEKSPFDFVDALDRLILIAEREAFGPSTGALIDEAVSRDIPWIRLDRHSLVQLGQGVHQQRIRATMTSQTGAIGVDIASDKSLTNGLLSSAGLPVPKSQVVRSADAAAEAAAKIGYPVVVKPLDGNHGRGVSLDLRTEEDVQRAYPIALDESRSRDVVVESYVTGNDYRVLVIGGKLAAVAERVPASVVGDGKLTVRQLVEKENADPRRGIGHERVLTRIKITDAAEEMVAKQGLTLDGVPERGQRVQLVATGNMSTGGTSIDRTREAHPDNVEIAETAAQVVGLDVAGIDFIAPDITVPVREQGGAIVEVNAAPGFRMHTHPTEGEPQFVAKPVIDLLFAPGSNARIPIISVTGTNGKTTTVRMIGHILKLMGRRVGMTTTDGIVVDGRLIRKGDMSGPRSAQMVLQNPSVDTAVFEVARGGILREGLGYDRNDVAVVTNVTGDHLGLRGVETMAQLAHVKSVIVEAVPRAGFAVLNADDPLVARMARQCRGSVVYFSMAEPGTESADRITGHLGRGGAAMVVQQTDDGELVVLRHADRTMPLLYTHLIPATFGGRARMNVANALAAAAAAWAAGAHLHDIRQGLRTFTTSFFQAPGRLNQVPLDGYRVFLDYCHNVDGMRRLTEFVDAMMVSGNGASRSGRAIGVIGIPGDRRDDDHREYGRIAASSFDEIIVREDHNLRGRKAGESAALVESGVKAAQKAGARCEQVVVVHDELEAALEGMHLAKAGDLVMLCCDDVPSVYRSVMADAKQHGVAAIGDPGEFSAQEG